MVQDIVFFEPTSPVLDRLAAFPGLPLDVAALADTYGCYLTLGELSAVADQLEPDEFGLVALGDGVCQNQEELLTHLAGLIFHHGRECTLDQLGAAV